MCTPEQAMAHVAKITPEGAALISRHYLEFVTPLPDSSLDIFRGEYRPGYKHEPRLKLEIRSSGGVTFCAYEVKQPDQKPAASIIDILMVSTAWGPHMPSLMLVDLEIVGTVPTNSIFLTPVDPRAARTYFKYIDTDDHLPGSIAERIVVNLTEEDITGLYIEYYAENIFVSRLDDGLGLDPHMISHLGTL